MIRKFYLVVATIFGLAISSCTNDVNEDIMADASGTLSNTDAEIVELKSGFTIKKKDGEYSMGDILLSEEQVKLLDETGSIYPAPNTVASGDSIMVGTIAGTKVIYPTNATRAEKCYSAYRI